eukprot:3254367-Rhodomonas_salina.5
MQPRDALAAFSPRSQQNLLGLPQGSVLRPETQGRICIAERMHGCAKGYTEAQYQTVRSECGGPYQGSVLDSA